MDVGEAPPVARAYTGYGELDLMADVLKQRPIDVRAVMAKLRDGQAHVRATRLAQRWVPVPPYAVAAAESLRRPDRHRNGGRTEYLEKALCGRRGKLVSSR